MKQNILDVIELEDLKKLIMSIANKKNFYNVDVPISITFKNLSKPTSIAAYIS